MDYIGIIKGNKVIGGKLYRRHFIDSEQKEIGIPTGVDFCSKGDYNYVTNANKVYRSKTGEIIMLPYYNKVQQETAIKKMILINKTLFKDDFRTAKLLKTKKAQTRLEEEYGLNLPIGIVLCRQEGENVIRYKLSVTVYSLDKKRSNSKSVYCGTENTWKRNFESTLAKAVKIRDESVALYGKLTCNVPSAK